MLDHVQYTYMIKHCHKLVYTPTHTVTTNTNNSHMHTHTHSHTRHMIHMHIHTSQLHYTCGNILPSSDCISTLRKAISREDSEYILCTVPLSNGFSEDIFGCVDSDLFLNSTSCVGNGNNIKQLFSFKREWFPPCQHEVKIIRSYVQISWRVWFSCVCNEGERERER